MRAKLEWQSETEAISPSEDFACPRKAPSPVWLRHPTSPPKGEVKYVASAAEYLSLGGEVGAKRRVRGASAPHKTNNGHFCAPLLPVRPA